MRCQQRKVAGVGEAVFIDRHAIFGIGLDLIAPCPPAGPWLAAPVQFELGNGRIPSLNKFEHVLGLGRMHTTRGPEDRVRLRAHGGRNDIAPPRDQQHFVPVAEPVAGAIGWRVAGRRLDPGEVAHILASRLVRQQEACLRVAVDQDKSVRVEDTNRLDQHRHGGPEKDYRVLGRHVADRPLHDVDELGGRIVIVGRAVEAIVAARQKTPVDIDIEHTGLAVANGQPFTSELLLFFRPLCLFLGGAFVADLLDDHADRRRVGRFDDFDLLVLGQRGDFRRRRDGHGALLDGFDKFGGAGLGDLGGTGDRARRDVQFLGDRFAVAHLPPPIPPRRGRRSPRLRYQDANWHLARPAGPCATPPWRKPSSLCAAMAR